MKLYESMLDFSLIETLKTSNEFC